jgi:hypothetical protein
MKLNCGRRRINDGEGFVFISLNPIRVLFTLIFPLNLLSTLDDHTPLSFS